MRRIVSNILMLIILTGAGYAFMTYSQASKDSFNRLPTPAKSVDIVNQNIDKAKNTDDTASLKDEPAISKSIEVYKAKAFDGKGIITPGISQEIISSTFWNTEYQRENSTIMSFDEINRFNTEITTKVSVVYDLEKYKDKLSKEELLSYISHYKIPTAPMYDYNGKQLTQGFYNSLTANTNISSIKDVNIIRYGITVKKSSLRSFPTDSGAYNSASNRTLDRFQETGCEPCEPVLILHESKDKKWFFVQIYNYRGWLKSDSIGVADKETVFKYTNPKDFLMVTGRSIPIQRVENSSELPKEFKMGTKLYLSVPDSDNPSSYRVKLPVRKADGSLDFTYSDISRDADICVGYLPYTRYNLIAQAFKLQGTPYDWGDKYSGRDCSSFIMYIYKTFGINLPRNTDEQEASGNTIKFNPQDNIKNRLQAIDKLKPGAALYMPGHVMMYLGKSNGQYYVIHAFLGYSVKEGSANKYYSTNQVSVTTLQLSDSNGVSFLERLTSAVQFEF
jgi:hypothetical protein